MKNKNLPTRILKKVLLRLWRFPWIRACLTVCVLSMVCASALQYLDAGKIQGSVIEATQKEELTKVKDTLIGKTYAEDTNNNTSNNNNTNNTQNNTGQDKPDDKNKDAMARLQEGLADIGKVLASVSTFLVKIMGMLLMFMLYWMSDLMDNTFILDGSMGDKLQIIWIFVRNIINITFAIILVVVAFINVAGYGAGEGNYALKKFLPKMALALIAVNFTFLGARIVLDVNNVLTTAVFALPQSVPDIGQFTASSSKPLKLYSKYRCSLSTTDINTWKEELKTKATQVDQQTTQFGGAGDSGLYQTGVAVGSFFDVCVADISGSITNNQRILGTNTGCQDGVCDDGTIEVGDLRQIRTNNFVWLMATRYQGIQNITKTPLQAKDWEALMLNAGFGFIFAVIYAVAYLAMFIILLVRVAILWICIALSPLIAIEILFPELMNGIKIGESDLKTMFLNHAFVPLKMAVPMSIGFIMISQMSLVGGGDLSKEIILTGGEFTRDGSIHRILYGIASAGLIWIGVFSASGNVYGKGIVEKIRGGVEGVGKFIGKAPLQLIPIVPVGGKMLPISSVGTMARTIAESVPSYARGLGVEAAEPWKIGGDKNKVQASMALNELDRAAQNNNISNTHRQNVAQNWNSYSEADKTKALRLLLTGATTVQMGANDTAATFLRNENNARLAREYLVTGNRGLTQDHWNTMTGVAQPPQGQQQPAANTSAGAANRLAAGVAGTGSIQVHMREKLTLAGQEFNTGSRSLNAQQLEAYLTQLIDNPAHLEEVLKHTESAALRTAIASNPQILETSLQGLSNDAKRRVAERVYNAYTDSNNHVAEAQARSLMQSFQNLGYTSGNQRSIQS